VERGFKPDRILVRQVSLQIKKKKRRRRRKERMKKKNPSSQVLRI
jgi:hypothetical protein